MPYINIFMQVKYKTDESLQFDYSFDLACQSTTPIEASILFEVWSRFYYPNVRDQLLAKVR